MGIGPFGQRQCYEMTGGVIDGPRLKGKPLGSGGDWMLIGPGALGFEHRFNRLG